MFGTVPPGASRLPPAWRSRSLPRPVTALATYDGYLDVGSADWYVTDGSLDYVTEHDLITGYDTGLFGPEDAVSRAQAVTVLWRMAGEPEPAADLASYPDCDYSEDSFYGVAVSWARETGVATGYEDGLFGPADPVTREQLATMLANYARSVAGLDVTSDGGELDEMADASAVTLRDGMAWAVDEGIISGDMATGVPLALPQGTAERAQATKMIAVFHRDVVAPAVEAVVAEGGATERVLSTQLNGTSYLLLPSCADLSALTLRFPERYGQGVEVSLDGTVFSAAAPRSRLT